MQVFNKPNKFLVHQISKIPRYKHNTIVGELLRAKRITSSFHKEIQKIREKYRNAGFPSNFVNKTIHNFKEQTEEIIIPEWLFEERKIFTVRLSCSSANEKFSKLFVNKIEYYTIGKIKTHQPSLNTQVNIDVLNLYRNGVTWIPHVFVLIY